MKKYISLLLALLMLLTCVMTLAACGKDEKPELDLKKAAKNLEKEEYEVEYEKNPTDEDLVGVVEYVEARAVGDKYDEYIFIYRCENVKVAKIWYERAKLSLEAEIKDEECELAYWEDVLDELEDTLSSDEIDAIEDGNKHAKEHLEYLEDTVIGRDGDIVWVGTKKAIRDTK